MVRWVQLSWIQSLKPLEVEELRTGLLAAGPRGPLQLFLPLFS